MIVNDYLNDRPEEVFKGIEIHKASCDDFVNILSEYNKTAYSSEMRLKAINLCNALKLDEAKQKLQEAHAEHLIEEYRRMHIPDRSYVNGMYDKNITEFRNEYQINAEYPFSMYG